MLRLVTEPGAELGEAPVWDAATGDVVWVDILAGAMHRYRVRDATVAPATFVSPPLSAAIPAVGGGLLLVLRDRVVLTRPGAESMEDAFELARVAMKHDDQRFNDATCDPAGRLWAGTMSPDHPKASALYRIDSQGEVIHVRGALGISNGIAFNPDATQMYHVDSAARRIDIMAFDVDRGTVGASRTFARLPPSEGMPDGLCVDREGGVWVAVWQGGHLRRYLPSGRLDAIVPTPTRCPSSCAFGGEQLDRLFVTSSAWGAGDQGAGVDGALMEGIPGVRGVPVACFGGSR